MNVTIENDDLVVRLHGLERLWALCRELRLPKASVKSVTWHETVQLPSSEVGWRVGTGFPGVLVAGWFRSRAHGTTFLYLPRAKYHWTSLEARQVLSLELTGYSRCRWAHLAYVDEPLASQIKTWAKA